MKEIYIYLTCSSFRDDFKKFCEDEWIFIKDPSFLYLPNCIWAMVRYKDWIIDEWFTTSGSEDIHKRLPSKSSAMWSIDFISFYKRLPTKKTTTMNYYNTAVIRKYVEWTAIKSKDPIEVISFQVRFGKSEDNVKAQMLRLIPEEEDIDELQILIEPIF